MTEWFRKKKEWLTGLTPRGRLILQLSAVGVIALLPVAAQALDIIDWLWNVIANIFLFFTALLGYLLILLVKVLIQLAQYSNFVAPGPTAVQIGWTVVRDLSNMFFILILLIMAFAIILGQSAYGDMQKVIRLFVMAIVINFSKTICGIFIDLGQVIMLTFVNGFAQAAGGNFLNAFQINKILQLRAEGILQGKSLALAAGLAFVMVAVAVCVIVVMVIQMAFRIVMLWILIILSPLAFLGSTFPPAKAATYDRWWGEFRKYITTGPIVAFFLWLALLSAQRAGGDIANHDGFTTETASDIEIAAQNQATGIASEAATSDAILSLIIVVCILIGGLKIAGESGTVGAGAANYMKSKGMSMAKGAGQFAVRNTVGRAKDAAVAAGGAGYRAAKGLALRGAGSGLSKITGGLVGAGLAAKGRQIQQDQRDSRKKFKEKFTGTAAERAQVNPGAFAKEIGNEKDPKKAAGLYQAATKDDKDGKVKKAMQGDKDAAGKMLNTLEQGAKTDPSLRNTFRQAAKDNFAAANDSQKMAAMKGMDAKEGRKFLDESGAKASELSPEMLKNAPGAGDFAMEQMMENPDEMQKIMEDPAKAQAMAEHAANKLEEAERDPKATDDRISKLTVDAIMTNSLSAGDLQGGGHDKAANALTNKPAAMERLAKGIDPKNPGQLAAGKAAMGMLMTKNPARAAKLADSGNYRHMMPDKPAETGGMKRGADGNFEPDDAQGPALELDTAKIEEAIEAGGERAASKLEEAADAAGEVTQRGAESIAKAGEKVEKAAEKLDQAADKSKKQQIIGNTGGGGGGEKV